VPSGVGSVCTCVRHATAHGCGATYPSSPQPGHVRAASSILTIRPWRTGERRPIRLSRWRRAVPSGSRAGVHSKDRPMIVRPTQRVGVVQLGRPGPDAGRADARNGDGRELRRERGPVLVQHGPAEPVEGSAQEERLTRPVAQLRELPRASEDRTDGLVGDAGLAQNTARSDPDSGRLHRGRSRDCGTLRGTVYRPWWGGAHDRPAARGGAQLSPDRGGGVRLGGTADEANASHDSATRFADRNRRMVGGRPSRDRPRPRKGAADDGQRA
jgi:hypothetical protein